MASSLGDVANAPDVSTYLSMTRSYADLELLKSTWNVERHTFVADWGEYTPMLEDVAVIPVNRYLEATVQCTCLTEQMREHYCF